MNTTANQTSSKCTVTPIQRIERMQGSPIDNLDWAPTIIPTREFDKIDKTRWVLNPKVKASRDQKITTITPLRTRPILFVRSDAVTQKILRDSSCNVLVFDRVISKNYWSILLEDGSAVTRGNNPVYMTLFTRPVPNEDWAGNSSPVLVSGDDQPLVRKLSKKSGEAYSRRVLNKWRNRQKKSLVVRTRQELIALPATLIEYLSMLEHLKMVKVQSVRIFEYGAPIGPAAWKRLPAPAA